MITRIEATRYRCFDKLDVELGEFRVLVGAKGSGNDPAFHSIRDTRRGWFPAVDA